LSNDTQESGELHDPTEPDMSEIDWGPTQRPLDDGDACPECGYTYDSDKWEVRHINTPGTAGESWKYTCPGCQQETCVVDT